MTTKDFELIALFAQDANGEDTYSNEAARMGHVEEYEKLVLPFGIKAPVPPELSTKNLGKNEGMLVNYGINSKAYQEAEEFTGNLSTTDLLRISFSNFVRLVQGNMADKDAWYVANLRARWIYTRCLYQRKIDRGVNHDEVVIGDKEDQYDLIAKNIVDEASYSAESDPMFVRYKRLNTYENAKWVLFNAETIWAISEYIFRVSGHHYTKDSEESIRRAFSAANEGNQIFPANLSLLAIFRVAIHPFGIKALPVLTAHFIGYDKVSNSLLLKTSGSPSGYAAVSTIVSAIKALASEVWYPSVRLIYGENIDTLTRIAQEIANDKYSFHASAGLYGLEQRSSVTFDGKTYSRTEIEDLLLAVAPLAEGFVQWSVEMKKEGSASLYSFANAKCISKRASANPSMVEKVRSIMMFGINQVAEAENLGAAVESAFGGVPKTKAVTNG